MAKFLDSSEQLRLMSSKNGEPETPKRSFTMLLEDSISKTSNENIRANIQLSPSEDAISDDYVWVEEEIEEEIEVETDEETPEVSEEENIEEEFENEVEREVEEEGEEEEEEEEGEIQEFQEIEQPTIEGSEERDEELEEINEEEVIDEIAELLEHEELIEELQARDLVDEDYKFVEMEGVEEETEGEEEILEDVELEEEETIKRDKKKKRKFKTITIIRKVKKLKPVLTRKSLMKRASEIQKTRELQEEKEKEQIEAANREWEKIAEILKGMLNEIFFMKRKNKTLSKSVIDYYKQKKVENIQEVDTQNTELMYKYYKKLKFYKEYVRMSNSESDRLASEVNALKSELQEVCKKYGNEKVDLLNWESELGKTVIVTQTGNPLEESIVKNIIQRHDLLLGQVSKERLVLIALGHEEAKIEAGIKNLINFEGNLSLLDYEQLRFDNHLFSEKIEERDNELAHLRKRVLEIIHTQAHVLEKTDSIINSIETKKMNDAKVNEDLNCLREKVNNLKRTRDDIRGESQRLRATAGLLTRPKLAVDYADSVSKIKNAKDKMQHLINTFNEQKKQISKLRKQIVDSAEFNDFF